MQTQGNEVPVSDAGGIDVRKIEKELASMWTEGAGDAREGDAGAGVTRACALNLLVYTHAGEDREQLDEMLEEVNEQHPGRTLLLVADRERMEASLEAYVSTRCRMLGGNNKQICGEQVTIEASGVAVESAASAVAPLLVPDVPVFLWWKDIPHYEDSLFNRMAAMADRIVIDSAAFDHPQDDLRRLAQIINERRGLMRVSDLNWGRLTSWRTLVAGFWDVPDYRQHLDRIDKVIVEYDPPDAAPGEIAPKALLIIGWLASRLGWQVEPMAAVPDEDRSGDASLMMRAGERAIQVLMRPTDDKRNGDGMMASLKLSATDGGAEFYVALSRDGTKLETEATVGGERRAGRILSYEARSEGKRLGRELAFLTRDKIYEETVKASAALIAALPNRNDTQTKRT